MKRRGAEAPDGRTPPMGSRRRRARGIPPPITIIRRVQARRVFSSLRTAKAAECPADHARHPGMQAVASAPSPERTPAGSRSAEFGFGVVGRIRGRTPLRIGASSNAEASGSRSSSLSRGLAEQPLNRRGSRLPHGLRPRPGTATAGEHRIISRVPRPDSRAHPLRCESAWRVKAPSPARAVCPVSRSAGRSAPPPRRGSPCRAVR